MIALPIQCERNARKNTETKHAVSYHVARQADNSNVLELKTISSNEFKRWFAPAFAKWLHENFANVGMVADQFGVHFNTACNWWSGSHRATGDAAARVFMCFPEAQAWFLREWESR